MDKVFFGGIFGILCVFTLKKLFFIFFLKNDIFLYTLTSRNNSHINIFVSHIIRLSLLIETQNGELIKGNLII